ncbi:MAG TPA: TadE family protein [Bryobacteraceae bacterium]|nr:TadE family protein [Bryobacteraceae bacterium]
MMRDRKQEKGSALVEMAFMMPWIAFLFVGVFDFGFYTTAAIATQNAARAAAIQLANGSTSDTCKTIRDELRLMPNMNGVTTCVSLPSAITNALPVAFCATTLNDTVNTTCSSTYTKCADCAGSAATGTNATAIQAVVTYQTVPLVPIPGILMGRMQLTRIAEARVLP